MISNVLSFPFSTFTVSGEILPLLFCFTVIVYFVGAELPPPPLVVFLVIVNVAVFCVSSKLLSPATVTLLNIPSF